VWYAGQASPSPFKAFGYYRFLKANDHDGDRVDKLSDSNKINVQLKAMGGLKTLDSKCIEQHSLQAYSRNLLRLFPVPIQEDGDDSGFTTFEVGANGGAGKLDDSEIEKLQAQTAENQKLKDKIEQMKQKRQQSKKKHEQENREAAQMAEELAEAAAKKNAEAEKTLQDAEEMKNKAARAAKAARKLATGALRGADDVRDDPADILDFLAKDMSEAKIERILKLKPGVVAQILELEKTKKHREAALNTLNLAHTRARAGLAEAKQSIEAAVDQCRTYKADTHGSRQVPGNPEPIVCSTLKCISVVKIAVKQETSDHTKKQEQATAQHEQWRQASDRHINLRKGELERDSVQKLTQLRNSAVSLDEDSKQALLKRIPALESELRQELAALREAAAADLEAKIRRSQSALDAQQSTLADAKQVLEEWHQALKENTNTNKALRSLLTALETEAALYTGQSGQLELARVNEHEASFSDIQRRAAALTCTAGGSWSGSLIAWLQDALTLVLDGFRILLFCFFVCLAIDFLFGWYITYKQ
jgi:hypothetical protein